MRCLALAAALLIAGCGEAPDAPPEPAEPARPEGKPLPASNAAGALPAPEFARASEAAGVWRSVDTGVAFGSEGRPLFAMLCDREAREMRFLRAGATPDAQRMRIVTALAASTLPVRPIAGGLEARIGASDSFLTGLAADRERIGVQIDGGTTLAMPADPAVADAIAACRKP